MASRHVLNALSFDIEDWFHLLDIPSVADPSTWSSFPTLVERYTDQILDILDQFQISATFFVVGWVAEKYPQLVPRIVRAGHEIASHSYWHRSVHRLTRQQFADDLKRSVELLQQQSGQKVLGYRAPGFSIFPRHAWAFDFMLDLGLRYDSSMPYLPHQPTTPDIERHSHQLSLAPSRRPILELPVSTLRVGPLRIRFCGGGYLRLLPTNLLTWLIHRRIRRNSPVLVYLHPRDFAVDCPRAKMSPRRRFMCYVGLGSTEHKFRRLCKEFRFGTCASVLGLDHLAYPADIFEQPARPPEVEMAPIA